MNGEVIKSFLVGLGFGVDEASLAKFNKAIVSATLRVGALYAAVKVAAAGIFLSISKISEGFEQMGYEYRIIAPAINKALMLRNALLSAYRAAGINIVKVIQESVRFNFSLAKTKFALDAIYKSVGAKFLPLLTKQLDIFRSKIYANMPRIQEALEKFVNFVFRMFAATGLFGGRVWSILQRVYELFKALDQATGGWSTKILAFAAAWKFLNLSFLATPLGMILAGLTAIILLYDDFKVWQEGGKSLIDWSSNLNRTLGILVATIAAIPAILGLASVAMSVWAGAVTVANGVVSAFSAVMSAYRYIMIAVNLAMWANPVGAMIAGFLALSALITLIIYKWDSLKNLWGTIKDTVSPWASNAASAIGSVFGSNQNGAFNPVAGLTQPVPLLPQGASNSQKVNQETNINIQGSADANSTAKAVATEQTKVNFDMTRNLKGAIR